MTDKTVIKKLCYRSEIANKKNFYIFLSVLKRQKNRQWWWYWRRRGVIKKGYHISVCLALILCRLDGHGLVCGVARRKVAWGREVESLGMHIKTLLQSAIIKSAHFGLHHRLISRLFFASHSGLSATHSGCHSFSFR
jgi:hypothetical protein